MRISIVVLQGLDILTTWFIWTHYEATECNPLMAIVLCTQYPFLFLTFIKVAIAGLFCWKVQNHRIFLAGVAFYAIAMLWHLGQIGYALYNL